VVTQGAKTREAIIQRFHPHKIQELSSDGATGAFGIIDGLVDGGTLWLSTHHPSAYGSFSPQRKTFWLLYRKKVAEFIATR